MTNNASSTINKLHVELVIRPSKRKPALDAEDTLSLLRRESHQGVLSDEEFRRLPLRLSRLKGCDDPEHTCVRVRAEVDHEDAPYVEVVFMVDCFPGNRNQENIRHDAATMLNKARARTYKATHRAEKVRSN